jgi:hypothetical protein
VCSDINLFFKDFEAKSESRKENIKRSKVADSDSDDEHEAAFQRGTSEMLWICMNDTYFVHIQLLCELAQSLIIESVFECLRLIKID